MAGTMNQGISNMRAESRSGAKAALWTVLVCALIPIVCLAIPIYVIQPFRPQQADQLALALTVRGFAPWISTLCALVALAAVIRVWMRPIGVMARIGLVSFAVLSTVACSLTFVNIFEVMFHPYPQPEFGPVNAALVDADDKVLSVRIAGEAHAYPIRIMGYHHIVNDSVGNVPIAVTYCTLCHAGLVWSRMVNGATLHFRLGGINNGNALMRDEETGTVWQQSTGQAIFGPFKGRQLQLIHSDELTFSLWRAEEPQGLVLKPDAKYSDRYETKDWEKHIETTHTVIDTQRSGIGPHELMLGVLLQGESKAYPVKDILASRLIQDQVDGTNIVLAVGPDNASLRVFQADIDGSPATFVPLQKIAQSDNDGIMQDSGTASVWDFRGCAIQGKLAGHCLKPIDSNKDYWFDWMNHHPSTKVFKG
jgi:hypothetical protein